MQKYGHIQNQRPQNCGNTDFCRDRCKIKFYPPWISGSAPGIFKKALDSNPEPMKTQGGSLLMPFGQILHLQTNFSGKKWCFRPLWAVVRSTSASVALPSLPHHFPMRWSSFHNFSLFVHSYNLHTHNITRSGFLRGKNREK